jgi:hypothetical protein
MSIYETAPAGELLAAKWNYGGSLVFGQDCRVILGIDPGPETSGAVLYNATNGTVIDSMGAVPLDELRTLIQREHWHLAQSFEVVMERVSAGPASTEVVLTSEVIGRVQEICETGGVSLHMYTRRAVLSLLCCTGAGNKDSQVRAAVLDLHGGTKAAAVGTKKAQGPLFGVSTHSWQALGAVCAHLQAQKNAKHDTVTLS